MDCIACGNQIPRKRLAAVPDAEFCLPCQAQRDELPFLVELPDGEQRIVRENRHYRDAKPQLESVQ